MLSPEQESEQESGRSFPLLRGFTTVILPLLVDGAIGLGYSFQQTMADSIEQYHAQSETGAVVNVLYQQVGKDPVAWQRQVDGEQTVIAEEMKGDLTELGVMCVSILRADGSEIISESTGKPCPKLAARRVSRPAGRWTSHSAGRRRGT